MGRKQLIAQELVNDFLSVHPALDFWDGMGIVAVGSKWLMTYDDGRGNLDYEFTAKPVCVTSKGEKFPYSPKELAVRKLFHAGRLDIPQGRWCDDDIEDFCTNPQSMEFEEVYNLIREQIEHYMDFIDKRIYALLAIYIIYTHFYPLFNMAPILQLWGEFRTGKSKILSLIEAMAFNPVNSSNITSSSIFRIVESRRSTILLDESEDMTTDDRTKEIINILLAGTGKSGEAVRQEKSADESYKTQTFKVFSPKVIANISGIQLSSLQSRIIRITTIGAVDRKKENRDVDQEDAKWKHIRGQLYRLLLSKHKAVIQSRDNLPDSLFTGRTLGIWKGLFAIANLCNEEVYGQMIDFAEENKAFIEAETEDDVDKPRKIIKLLIIFVKENEDKGWYTPGELFNYFKNKLASPRPTSIAMGMMLGKLGFHSRTLSEKRFYHITLEQLQSMQSRR